jgi:membrane-bound ClpP family serine protease
MTRNYRKVLLWVAIISSAVVADTFRNKEKNLVYTGYATQEINNGFNVVVTKEQGALELNLAEYNIDFNDQGRNSFIPVLSIDGDITYEYATQAFETAIVEEADKGPLLIVIELDTPGGRVDLAKRICAAISRSKYCKTVAYVRGGESGGAFSAGAAIALACDNLYMAPETTIGAAAMITTNEAGMAIDMKEAFGETVGEKYNAAWRNYLASLAQENHRPGAIAKAMADADVGVVEVKRNERDIFIETQEQRPDDVLVRTVCRKGELLALPAENAVSFHIADDIADSRQALLTKLGYADAQVQENKRLITAKEDFERALRRFEQLNEKLDLKFKEITAKSQRSALTRSQAVRDFDELIRNGEYLLRLKRGYPDIPVSEEQIIELVNSIKAESKSIKAMR